MSEEEVEEENDDDIPYNPKNLPLGWDGNFDLIHLSHRILRNLLMISVLVRQAHPILAVQAAWPQHLLQL